MNLNISLIKKKKRSTAKLSRIGSSEHQASIVCFLKRVNFKYLCFEILFHKH